MSGTRDSTRCLQLFPLIRSPSDAGKAIRQACASKTVDYYCCDRTVTCCRDQRIATARCPSRCVRSLELQPEYSDRGAGIGSDQQSDQESRKSGADADQRRPEPDEPAKQRRWTTHLEDQR